MLGYRSSNRAKMNGGIFASNYASQRGIQPRLRYIAILSPLKSNSQRKFRRNAQNWVYPPAIQ